MEAFYNWLINLYKKLFIKKPTDTYNYMFEYDENGNPIMSKKYDYTPYKKDNNENQ